MRTLPLVEDWSKDEMECFNTVFRSCNLLIGSEGLVEFRDKNELSTPEKVE